MSGIDWSEEGSPLPAVWHVALWTSSDATDEFDTPWDDSPDAWWRLEADAFARCNVTQDD